MEQKTSVHPQQVVPARRWTDEEAQKVARSVKKMFIQKRVDDKTVAYLITVIFRAEDTEVIALLRRYAQVRKFRNGKQDLVCYGRPAKRVLERILPFLEDHWKDLADILLAFPVGRRKKDVKERLYQRFYAVSYTHLTLPTILLV